MTFLDLFADEEWRDVVGFEGQYKVSNYGRVLSVSRIVNSGPHGGKRKTENVLLKKRITPKGYERVYLNDKGRTRFLFVHRLVAIAFIPNPENKLQVNHIDGVKTNNHVENLEWCTNSENQLHAYRIGLNRVTGRAGRKKVPVEMIDRKTNTVIQSFESMNEAARRTGIPQPNIRKVIIGERNHAGGYGWKRKVG